MPWKECDRVLLRRELVALALRDGVSIAALARRFGISRKTAYKWLERHRQGGDAGLARYLERPDLLGRAIRTGEFRNQGMRFVEHVGQSPAHGRNEIGLLVSIGECRGDQFGVYSLEEITGLFGLPGFGCFF